MVSIDRDTHFLLNAKASPELCEGSVRPFVRPAAPTGRSVCLHRRRSQLEESLAVVRHDLKFRLHAPQPGQHVGSERCKSRAGGDTGHPCSIATRQHAHQCIRLLSTSPGKMKH